MRKYLVAFLLLCSVSSIAGPTAVPRARVEEIKDLPMDTPFWFINKAKDQVSQCDETKYLDILSSPHEYVLNTWLVVPHDEKREMVKVAVRSLLVPDQYGRKGNVFAYSKEECELILLNYANTEVAKPTKECENGDWAC